MNDSYSVLSKYYDALMSDYDYTGTADFLLGLYGKRNTQPPYKLHALDLACGTGAFSRTLASYGIEVTAADISEEMLNQAVSLGTRGIMYVQADMANVAFDKSFNLITSACDGVNYLHGEQLYTTFSNIREMLTKEGLFVFDISTPFKLRNVIGNNVFFRDNASVSLVWANALSPKGDSVTMDLTFFERKGDIYVRRDESHVQYAHEDATILAAAKSAGLVPIAVCGASFGDISDDDLRRYYVFGK